MCSIRICKFKKNDVEFIIMCGIFDLLSNNCEDIHCPDKSPCLFYLNLFFQLLIAIAVYTLLIFGISYSYSHTYGDIGLENCGALYVCGMVGYTIYLILMTIYSSCGVASHGLIITWYITCIYSAACMLLTLQYTSDEGFAALKNVAFKNWRVDIEYIVFEAKNGCNGLLAMSDPTANGCDDIYSNQLRERLSLLSTISITTGALILAALLIYSVPETYFRIANCFCS